MATTIRPKLSSKNKYWISKHRHYELKHFCLQYHDWIGNYEDSDGFENEAGKSDTRFSDRTSRHGLLRAKYSERIKMIEYAAMNADEELKPYIFRAVTEGLSYTYLKSRLEIPCSRDTYYDRYRRFFWLLDQMRD
jgi:hypothetical protein